MSDKCAVKANEQSLSTVKASKVHPPNAPKRRVVSTADPASKGCTNRTFTYFTKGLQKVYWFFTPVDLNVDIRDQPESHCKDQLLCWYPHES